MSNRSSTLQITRLLKHDRTRVFSALTDPVKMTRWFFGMKGGQAKVANDLRPGGSYTIEMTDDRQSCAPHGTYLEIVPPEKLVFTWSSGNSGVVGTKVTIELFAQGTGTKLVITHELPEDQIAPHREGWNVCFDHLELYLASQPVVAASSRGP
jgi:uncharacterized protein YndB with AHSA1/START domain